MTEPGGDEIEDVLERGKRLLAEAKTTIADLDALSNTAVLPVLSFDDDATSSV